MAAYKEHMVGERTKLLLVGDSGSGKTSAIASLANAGYKVRILDFDNGLDVLSDYLTPAGIDNVSFVTLRDKLADSGAYDKAVRMVSNWIDGEEKFGAVSSWGTDTVLVIDSLTFMGESALRRSLRVNGKKPTDKPAIPDWGDAVRDCENLIMYLTGDDVKCNVVMTAHLMFVEDDGGSSKAYPTVIGNKLPTRLPRYFNCVVRMDVKPSPTGGKRVIRTVSDYKMHLKTPAASVLPAEMEPDLAELFKAIQNNAAKKAGKG